jgi:NADPH:quinone reductase-like Zn-dependent oxidoreductase
MFAAYLGTPDPGHPLRALRVGEIDGKAAPSGWVRVQVKAASLNQHDVWTLRGAVSSPGGDGSGGREAGQTALGMDAAGTTDDGQEVIVHAVLGDPRQGWGDETLDPGRTFLPDAGYGTLAEYVIVPPANLVPKPPELSWVEAACLPTAWLTAYRMLFTKAQALPGQSLLVQGAGGAVATAVIVLGRAAGLRVAVATRSQERGSQAQAIGAHEWVALGDRGGGPYDIVIDPVGEASWKYSVASLRPGGCLVTCGASTGFIAPTNLARVFSKQLRILGSTMGTRQELDRLVAFLVMSGARPVVDSVRPLTEAHQQFARLIDGSTFGKLVVQP